MLASGKGNLLRAPLCGQTLPGRNAGRMVSIAPPQRRHPATTWWLAAVGLVFSLPLSLGSARGEPILTHALPNRQLIQVHWMRVDPLHPRTLFASGAGFCHNIQRPSDY